MRALFALVFVAACATVYASSPGARVAGCWIDRSEHAVTTMRWFGDEMRPGALRGDWLLYPEDAETPQTALYRLEPRAENWALCQVEAAGERCWQVAEAAAPKGCAIKGNVSANGRIYHMPWDPWYEKVKMDERRGKRWFCSQEEAASAGWRPASTH